MPNTITDTPTTAEIGPRLRRDPTHEELLNQLWSMTPTERVTAMYAGRLTLDQLGAWSRRYPKEVPLLNGEFWFIAITTPEIAEADD